MYAVVETGGKQVRVEAGNLLLVERLGGEVGETVDLGRVHLLVDGGRIVAEPGALKGAKVRAVIKAHGRGRKVIAFRYKKRKNIRVKRGHRQPFTQIQVTEILAS
ncbi:MAG: 50S ribosomal protein L21 [Candidatus Tectomicrobia bacterium RIFCSPLOWO2_12_FULL_69_37]|nr:MAG: 50S ribosomal protein L21 [Candidatus Tectomicrobia bacterium RIFCSPLOWO2_02_FULL_70_19]OGL63671.1 MAG: 50S ribosomal protein L21 [Candidatus Tectomicrobia bacterium RIFCSPLOWO2_12_FULL_69_37]